MKAIAVALYLLNSAGGQPVLVANFPTMAECAASTDGAREATRFGQYVCIPIMRNAQ